MECALSPALVALLSFDLSEEREEEEEARCCGPRRAGVEADVRDCGRGVGDVDENRKSELGYEFRKRKIPLAVESGVRASTTGARVSVASAFSSVGVLAVSASSGGVGATGIGLGIDSSCRCSAMASAVCNSFGTESDSRDDLGIKTSGEVAKK